MPDFDVSSVLYRQVAGSLHSIACDIISEDPGTEDHNARLAWARKILLNNEGPVEGACCWMWVMLTNNELAANPTTTDDATVKEIAAGFLPVMLMQSPCMHMSMEREWFCCECTCCGNPCVSPSASESPSESPSQSPSPSGSPSDSPSTSPSVSESPSESPSDSPSPSESPSASPSIMQ